MSSRKKTKTKHILELGDELKRQPTGQNLHTKPLSVSVQMFPSPPERNLNLPAERGQLELLLLLLLENRRAAGSSGRPGWSYVSAPEDTEREKSIS